MSDKKQDDRRPSKQFANAEREARFTATAEGARIYKPGRGLVDLDSLPPPREEPKK